MPIVSSIVAQTRDKGSGVTNVREAHTFHTGLVRNYRYDALTGTEYYLMLADHAALLESRERVSEGERFEIFIQSGGSPSDFNREHSTAASLIKRVIRAFMNTKNPTLALAVAQWIKDNLTNTQIEAHVPLVVREKIRSRIANLVAMQTMLEEDASHIVVIPND